MALVILIFHRNKLNCTFGNRPLPAELQDNSHLAAQKDTDTRWTKKNNEKHFGYKNHISVDVAHKLIRGFACTHAAAHDSRQLETLLPPHSSRDVWADSAYGSEEKEEVENPHASSMLLAIKPIQ